MKTKILILIFTLFTVFLKAQTGVATDNFKGADYEIKHFLATWKIKGGSVAITKNGKLVYNKGFGFSDQDNSISAKPNDLYRIASVSKPITAIAIMQMIQNKYLSLTDTVFGKNKILNQPYYLDAISDSRICSITIQNLLEHTAGWDRAISCDGYSDCDPPFFPLHVTAVEKESNPVGDSTLIKFLLQKGLNHNPGEVFAYSNVGYLILGKVIEKISKVKYEEYVEKNIFEPLSIHDIHLGKNLRLNKHERETEYFNSTATLSCYGDGSTVPWQYGGFNLEAMNAHGGWIASASDLTKLILAVDGFKTSLDILTPGTIDLMTSQGASNPFYAKGWCVNRHSNWWHTGSMDGTASFICRTNDGYTWAFLFNSRSDDSNEFWSALDKLPWNCIKNISESDDVNLYAPEKNATHISANIFKQDSIFLNWVNGNGDARIVLASEDSAFMNFPVDGTDYAANACFGKGTNLGGKTFVIYNGTDNNCLLLNVDPEKRYYIRCFEYYKNADTYNQPVYQLGDCDEKIIIQKQANRIP